MLSALIYVRCYELTDQLTVILKDDNTYSTKDVFICPLNPEKTRCILLPILIFFKSFLNDFGPCGSIVDAFRAWHRVDPQLFIMLQAPSVEFPKCMIAPRPASLLKQVDDI